MECPICLENINKSDSNFTITNPCNHFYHFDCIDSWTKLSSSTCPKCRIELTSIINKSNKIEINYKQQDKLVNMINNESTSIDNHLNTERDNQIDSHLHNQKCCICDNFVLINQIIICPQCSSLYHRSCSDGLNCPLCEEWIDNVTSPHLTRRRRNNHLNIDNDNEYYTKIVDELNNRTNNVQKETSNDTEEQAWNVLNLIQNEKTTWAQPPISTSIPATTTTVSSSSSSNITTTSMIERKLKRPNSQKHELKLTHNALAKLDSKFNSANSRKNPKNIRSQIIPHQRRIICKPDELSFIQKLIIQRLLLKPIISSSEISNKLSFDDYTNLNKLLSHKLYDIIKKNEISISYINGIIELAEREGFLPFENRKDVDKFNVSFHDNSIVTRFVNCSWLTNNNHINTLINDEITKFMQDKSR